MLGEEKSTGMSARALPTTLYLAVLISVLLVLAGCSKNSATMAVSKTAGNDEETVQALEATGSVPEATVGASPEEETIPKTEATVETSPFTDAPQARGGGREGADGVLAVRFGKHEGYERTVIDLGTGDQAAWQVPEWNLSSPAGDGLLRVNFPSVDSTQVSDGTFDSPMLKDFHVVRAPEGGMFVDIVSEEAFTYRVLELRKPARLVVDFAPAPAANLSTPPPLTGGNTVVTEPRTVTTASKTLTVSGYSRNPEASNDIVVLDSTGKEIVREAVQSNDWTQTWGYFETTLDVPAFYGKGKLKVGAASPRDGRFEGVRLRLIGGG